MEDIVIESLSAKGDGIAEISGERITVPFALPAEKVRVNENGEIIEILKPVAGRQTPPCRHFYKCGGCHLQHMGDEFYVGYKRGVFLDALKRAGIGDEESKSRRDGEKILFNSSSLNLLDPLSIIGPYSRRRAIFKISAGKVGFYAADSHDVVGISECHILEPEIFAFAQKLKAIANIKEALVTLADTGLDVLLYSENPPSLTDSENVKNLPAARIAWKSNEKIIPIISRRAVAMQFGKAKVELPYEAFLQPTKKGQELISAEVTRSLKKEKTIVDLFSGCGTYSFPLAEKSKIHAVEMGAEMVQAIKKAAAEFQMPVTAEKRNLYNTPLQLGELENYSGCVINPPRTGALNQCKILAKSGVKKIVMVSCNPDTFARDARVLIAGGYKMEKALAIDQFHWTSHLEIVAVFVRG